MNDKLIFRAATTYQKRLCKIKTQSKSYSLTFYTTRLLGSAGELNMWCKRFEQCQSLSWNHASKYLKDNMLQQLCKQTANQLAIMERDLENDEINIPSIKELFEEIKSLNSIFDSLNYRRQVLSITTHPISLKDEHNNEISLGRFKIYIDLKIDPTKHGYERMIQVEALDPNPAAENEDITHPHVKENEPCLGEALDIIQNAFVEGRMESVFMILDSLLKTYNPGSPHVPIDEWNEHSRTECDRCGEKVDQDEITYCEICEHYCCGECCDHCDSCREYVCSECIVGKCVGCHQSICQSCFEGRGSSCDGCQEVVCDNCIHGCCETFCENCVTNCEDCGIAFCDQCHEPCHSCEEKYCDDCKTTCDKCGYSFCKECLIGCESCLCDLCQDCSIKCENCNKDFCKDCYDQDECSLLKELSQ